MVPGDKAVLGELVLRRPVDLPPGSHGTAPVGLTKGQAQDPNGVWQPLLPFFLLGTGEPQNLHVENLEAMYTHKELRNVSNHQGGSRERSRTSWLSVLPLALYLFLTSSGEVEPRKAQGA